MLVSGRVVSNSLENMVLTGMSGWKLVAIGSWLISAIYRTYDLLIGSYRDEIFHLQPIGT